MSAYTEEHHILEVYPNGQMKICIGVNSKKEFCVLEDYYDEVFKSFNIKDCYDFISNEYYFEC